jgi:DNA (cytosine-5)-methyltransferase 1
VSAHPAFAEFATEDPALSPLWIEFYSGEGGSATGIARAGFRVLCVDLDPQPRNPFEFVQGDALKLIPELVGDLKPAAIGGGPPCQDYSILRQRTGKRYPRLIAPTRELFRATGLPYVIENVEKAGPELIAPVTLCGSMFRPAPVVDGLLLKRHRLFESNVKLIAPWPDSCRSRGNGWRGIINVHGGGAFREHKGPDGERIGHGNKASAAEAAELLGTPWMSVAGMNECIPPRYGEWFARQVMDQVRPAR